MSSRAGSGYHPCVSELETAPPEAPDLLEQRIDHLGLRLEGSPVERFVTQLYRELERKGLRHFRPVCYLTDEWGCPDQEPVIGVPFYLADLRLQRIEGTMSDNLEDEREIMMYLRHEAGHAFNYAYRLYETEEWRELFGLFHKRYREEYRPVPFSRQFVRHIAGWYAQKHPDEDFAETFAVWLTPRSDWRDRYRGWPAMRKLRYVDRVARAVRDVPPPVPSGEVDLTVDQMHVTVADFYRRWARQNSAAVDVSLEVDLRDVFLPASRRRKGVRPAANFVAEHRAQLTDKITYWTGVKRPVVRSLLERIENVCREQRLLSDLVREPAQIIELSAYATALAMNYLTRRKFHG